MMMYITEVDLSEHMVRKQIYIPRRQDALLKKLAKQRGVSEAEVIRQALEREVEIAVPVTRESKKALDEIIAYARSLRDRPEFMQGKPYKFNREELYEERESRWIRDDKGE
jgi:hypothetical protein